MKQQFEDAIAWLKKQPVKGCITGSALLEIFNEPGQDLDVFIYDEKSFTKLLYAMHHNDLFHILDPLETWKFKQFTDKVDKSYNKIGLTTIKFTYNTAIPINIILKRGCENIFSVLSTFDMDIISKGFDIATGKYLDLSENRPGKIATWNTWNPAFSTDEIWKISRILRQLERCFKYHKRGYNTDLIVEKYIELIDVVQDYQSLFESEKFNEKLKIAKENTSIVKKICEKWLETHEISEDTLELMTKKMKEL
jgi:hypothetical protein